MDNKIQFSRIKEAIQANRKLADLNTNKEGKSGRHKKGHWDIYDSDLENISQDFFYCLPKEYQRQSSVIFFNQMTEETDESPGVVLKKYIIDTLKEGDNLAAIEFGGPGSKLFASFPDKFFEKTIGVCLKDVRFPDEKEKDSERGHEVIPGDILELMDKRDDVYKKVEESLNGRKVSLIMCRICGPLDRLHKHPAILDRLIRKWYSLLDQNGLIFVQITFSIKDAVLAKKIRRWSTAISEKFPTIEIQEKQGLSDMPESAEYKNEFIRALRIHKKPGAPEKLPPATQLFSSQEK